MHKFQAQNSATLVQAISVKIIDLKKVTDNWLKCERIPNSNDRSQSITIICERMEQHYPENIVYFCCLLDCLRTLPLLQNKNGISLSNGNFSYRT